MRPLRIFEGTAEFMNLKLAMGLGMTAVATALYAVMVGLASLASPVLAYIMLPLWLALSVFLCRKFYMSVGYRVDIGHVGIITGAVSEGYIPKNAVTLSFDMASGRFRTAQNYFHAKKRIDHTVMELNTVFTRATSLMGEVPGMGMMVALGRQFLRLFLTYMTRCCFAYTYFRGDEGLYLSATEGTAVYAVNWKRLTKNASDIAIVISVAVAVLTAALGIGLYALMGVMGLGRFAYYGVILAAAIVLTLKHAYLDSWFTVYFIEMYMTLAEDTEPSPEFFHRLCTLSRGFAAMTALANGMLPTPKRAHTTSRAKRRKKANMGAHRAPDRDHPLICPRCRSANRRESRFCTGCGGRLQ